MIKWIFLGPIALIATLLILLFGKLQFDYFYAEYWEKKVAKMCQNDGGVTAFEKIQLAPDSKHVAGSYVSIPLEPNQTETDDYYLSFEIEPIKEGNLHVGRAVYQIVRKSDNKILGNKISYSGAIHFWLASGPHTFGCNSVPGFDGDLHKAVFSIE